MSDKVFIFTDSDGNVLVRDFSEKKYFNFILVPPDKVKRFGGGMEGSPFICHDINIVAIFEEILTKRMSTKIVAVAVDPKDL